jgi:hypothetical protein
MNIKFLHVLQAVFHIINRLTLCWGRWLMCRNLLYLVRPGENLVHSLGGRLNLCSHWLIRNLRLCTIKYIFYASLPLHPTGGRCFRTESIKICEGRLKQDRESCWPLGWIWRNVCTELSRGHLVIDMGHTCCLGDSDHPFNVSHVHPP